MRPEKNVLLCGDCTSYMELFYDVKPRQGWTRRRIGFCRCCGRPGLFRRYDLTTS